MTTLARLAIFVALGALLSATLERTEPNSTLPKFELEPWTPGVLEIHEPGVHPLFTINKVLSQNGELSVYISSSNPDAVAEAIQNGKLEAQLSEHDNERGGTASEIDFRFMKKVTCTGQNEITLPYEDPIPSNCTTKDVSLFFAVDLALGPWRDLAFGCDPDSLWLIR